MPGETHNYSPEFQRQIVAFSRSGQTHNVLAREYGCARTKQSAGGGVAAVQPALNSAESVAQPPSERTQNLLLLRENRQLREERKFLKKAIALFAQDNGAR